MSQLFVTALLLTLGAGSTALLATAAPPAPPPPLRAETLRAGMRMVGVAEPTLASYLAQVDQAPVTTAEAAIAVEVCLSLPDWQRPSEAAQAKQLESMPDYGEALAVDPLATLVKDWWGHDIFSFTTYGLSARTDPLYLSGVWTALDHTWDCYGGDQPEQINRGELAEMWLLHHRLVALEWQDGQYVATVEPAATGLQLIQFPRRERGEGLPLQIVTTTGQALAVLSGDW